MTGLYSWNFKEILSHFILLRDIGVHILLGSSSSNGLWLRGIMVRDSETKII